MEHLVNASLQEHQEAIAKLITLSPHIAHAGQVLQKTLTQGGCIFSCGNGGSAADAQHFAAELTGRFERNRHGLRAIALTTDTAALTSIGNDFGFEWLFARQLEALGRTGDALIALSTSGNSNNVLRAVEQAKKQGIVTVGLLGRDGGQLQTLVDIPLIMPSQRTARIQELHGLILHIFCEMIDSAH